MKDVANVLIYFRLEINVPQLAAVAVSRLQRELAKDGREPNMVSKRMQDKSISRKGTASGSSDASTGKNFFFFNV